MGVMKDQSPVDVLRETRVKIIKEAYCGGLRSEDLEDQPAPGIREGLEALARGEEINKEWLRRIDESGGTDHPDPFT